MTVGDRIKESTTTTGTGTYQLDGTVSTFQSFVTGIEAANGVASPRVYAQVSYTIIQSDAAGNNIDIEIGQGTLTKGVGSAKDTLTRDSIVFSSNGNAAVDWGAGTKTIVCAPQANDVGQLPFWRFVMTSDQTALAASTWHEVDWHSLVESYGVTASVANNSITILKGGRYAIGMALKWSLMSSNAWRTRLLIDAVQDGEYQSGRSSSNEFFGFVDERTFTVGDVITMEAWHQYVSTIDLDYAATTDQAPVSQWFGTYLGE